MLTMVSPMSVPKTPAGWVQWLFGRAAVGLFVPEHRALYGVRWSGLDRMIARRGAGLVINSISRAVPYVETLQQMRIAATGHPFGGPPMIVRPGRSPVAGTAEAGATG